MALGKYQFYFCVSHVNEVKMFFGVKNCPFPIQFSFKKLCIVNSLLQSTYKEYDILCNLLQ